jgi:MFS family permease
MGSAIPSNCIKLITAEFNITSPTQTVLPISIYLIGYVIGPLVFGPLSEQVGRKWIMLGTYGILLVFTMACALAPTWNALLVFRFFCGVGASAPIAVVGGIYADIYDDPLTRGRANAYFMGV